MYQRKTTRPYQSMVRRETNTEGTILLIAAVCQQAIADAKSSEPFAEEAETFLLTTLPKERVIERLGYVN